MPLDLIMGLSKEDDGTVRTADEFIQEVKERSKECYEVARKHLQVAAERRKKNYDIRVKEAEFVVGDWVWYWYPRRYQRSPKWHVYWTIPYCACDCACELCAAEVAAVQAICDAR